METKGYKNWWFITMNGLIFIILGGLLLFFTRETILTLIKYIGIIMLGCGIIFLLVGINKIRREKPAALMLTEAIGSLAIGLALLLFLQASISLFLMLIGIWAIIIGIIQLVIIVNLKSAVPSKNVHLINGLLTIGLGILLLFNPFDWAVFMGKVIGICAILFGVLLVYFSIILRSTKEVVSDAPTSGS
jgi:uncharacterized membrane protein HdeD (DUF308 family)